MGYTVGVGDEAGDTGFRFAQGSSEYFAYAFALVSDPDRLRRHLAAVKKRLNWSDRVEIKFHQLSEARRTDFFQEMRMSGYVVRGLVVHKRRLLETCRAMDKNQFHAWAIAALLQHIAPAELAGIRLVLDELSDMPRIVHLLRRQLRAQGLAGIRRIGYRRSQQEVLIQFADMCAGSILREATTGQCFHENIREHFKVWHLM